MKNFMVSRYASLEAYTPGEQPRDMEYVKLNTNESPFPPAPGVIAAINGEEVEKMHTFHNFDGGWYLQLDKFLTPRISVIQKDNSFVFYLWDNHVCKSCY